MSKKLSVLDVYLITFDYKDQIIIDSYTEKCYDV